MKRRRGRGVLPHRAQQVEVRGHSSLCSHDRVCYPSRAAAHSRALEIRKTEPAAKRQRPYPCTDVAGAWHIGILPDDVIAGAVTADEYYGARAPSPVAGGNQ